jgi:hypothetical protein
MTPLHLAHLAAHLDLLISDDSLGCLQNLDRILLIREIFTST